MGYVRPDPGPTLKRRIWNYLHWNLGRVTILAAWACVYLGIYVYHNGIYKASYKEWLVPVAVVMGILVIGDAVLRLIAPAPPPAQQDAKQVRIHAHACVHTCVGAGSPYTAGGDSPIAARGSPLVAGGGLAGWEGRAVSLGAAAGVVQCVCLERGGGHAQCNLGRKYLVWRLLAMQNLFSA